MPEKSSVQIINEVHSACIASAQAIAGIGVHVRKLLRARKRKILGEESDVSSHASHTRTHCSIVEKKLESLRKAGIGNFDNLSDETLLNFLGRRNQLERWVSIEAYDILFRGGFSRGLLLWHSHDILQHWWRLPELESVRIKEVERYFAEANYQECVIGHVSARSYHSLVITIANEFFFEAEEELFDGCDSRVCFRTPTHPFQEEPLVSLVRAFAIDLAKNLSLFPGALHILVNDSRFKEAHRFADCLAPEFLRAKKLAAAELEVRAGHADTHILSSAEQDIVQALRELVVRTTTEPLLIRAFGKVTSDGKAILASLVRRGVLTSRRNPKPRGYGLPEWD